MLGPPRYALAWTVALVIGALARGAPAPAHAQASQSCPAVGFTRIEPDASALTRPVKDPSGRTIHVDRNAITNTADIAEAQLGGDEVDALLLLKFHPDAESRLIAATTDHPGLRLAFVADHEALLAVTWEGRYGLDPGGVQISLHRNLDRARTLLAAIHRCAGSAR